MSEPPFFPFSVSRELYQWFLLTYGASALVRMAVEGYKQIAILKTAWYDVPTAAFIVLEDGFIQHVLLSLSVAEALNMVLGALYKERVRRRAIEENNRAWQEWMRRKAEAKAKGDPFNEPSPAERPAEAKP